MNRRRIISSSRSLMTIAALSLINLGLAPAPLEPWPIPPGGWPAPVPYRYPPPYPYSVPAPRFAPRAFPSDRFVIVPPEGLDPRFVIPAPTGIDDAMIDHLRGR